ncbi:general stress protein [Siminovitchia sediminis]|uniref:General stress protein n=1 Tax=Siminovitchia sediminis TaxID=1274353 RepID=A0ABW4KKD2_9BACI
MNRGLIGVYASEEEVINVIKTFLLEGFSEENFSILSVDRSKADMIERETHVHQTPVASEEAYGIISGFLTGISGGFAVPGLTVPGLGPIIAAGPLASWIEGKSHENVKDLLITSGLDEEEAERYADELNNGKIILFYEQGVSD